LLMEEYFFLTYFLIGEPGPILHERIQGDIFMKRTTAIASIAILFITVNSLIAYKGYLHVVADIEGRFNTAQLVMARDIAHSIEGLAEGTKREMMIASLIPSIQKGDRGDLSRDLEADRPRLPVWG